MNDLGWISRIKAMAQRTCCLVASITVPRQFGPILPSKPTRKTINRLVYPSRTISRPLISSGRSPTRRLVSGMLGEGVPHVLANTVTKTHATSYVFCQTHIQLRKSRILPFGMSFTAPSAALSTPFETGLLRVQFHTASLTELCFSEAGYRLDVRKGLVRSAFAPASSTRNGTRSFLTNTVAFALAPPFQRVQAYFDLHR